MSCIRFSLLLLFLWVIPVANAQQQPDVTIHYEETNRGYRILADNREYAEVSIYLTFDLDNLRSSRGNKKLFVIPPRSRQMRITDLNVLRKDRRYSFRYSSQTWLGDLKDMSYDSTHVYQLPFKAGQSYSVVQGYDGSFSHQGIHALDFAMGEGTEVTAMRSGTVVSVVQQHTIHCPKKECMRFNNEIIILHEDGTFAEYTHLAYQSAKVKPGDKVNTGDVLAQSGHTGYSTAPHLHVSIYKNRLEGRVTFPMLFHTEETKNPVLLEQGQSYGY
jgi:murein DD-endopeptidase MepM/ murein hydrolase activator NlpD